MESKKRVLLLNTSHYSMDDRVFYHQAKSLQKNGYTVQIISTKEFLCTEIENITINSYDDSNSSQKEKYFKIIEQINKFQPTIIICDSPFAILASYKYKQKQNENINILYDITEWYPSKKNLKNVSIIFKPIKFILLIVLFIIAGFKSDAFLFGEHYKSLIFRRLYFKRKYMFLSYFPDLKYIKQREINFSSDKLDILYSGNVNIDKGIDSVLYSVDECAKLHPNTKFIIRIIGNFPTSEDKIIFKNITSTISNNIEINHSENLPYIEFCNEISKYDLFMDLRVNDIENNHCLPIKLFYYIACGKPVIYSNLKSIKHEFDEFNFGYLCNPKDYQIIAQHLSNYLTNSEIYHTHAKNALLMSKTKYNWSNMESNFVSFINTL